MLHRYIVLFFFSVIHSSVFYSSLSFAGIDQNTKDQVEAEIKDVRQELSLLAVLPIMPIEMSGKMLELDRKVYFALDSCECLGRFIGERAYCDDEVRGLVRGLKAELRDHTLIKEVGNPLISMLKRNQKKVVREYDLKEKKAFHEGNGVER